MTAAADVRKVKGPTARLQIARALPRRPQKV